MNTPLNAREMYSKSLKKDKDSENETERKRGIRRERCG